MIAYLKGTIITQTKGFVVLLLNDAIGYKIFINELDYNKLAVHNSVILYCYHHITDRSQELYGFLNESSKDFFLLLINNVAGIGPKSALKIISKAPTDNLIKVIKSGNVDALSSLGIGAKTAEKILLGLKDKLMISNAPASTPEQNEAIDALVNLGYSPTEARHALKNVNSDKKTVEEIIKEALKNF